MEVEKTGYKQDMSQSKCIVCGHKNWHDHLVCKDYLVSHKKFELIKCQNCGYIATSNRPDEAQIGAYYQSESYVSHSDTQKGVINKIYHLARSWALSKKIEIIKQHNQTGEQTNYQNSFKILDIGCGTGYFLSQCKKQNWQIFGIEPDTKAAALAKQYTQSPDIFADLQEMSTINGLDAVSMWHVLEHVYDLESVLATINQKLHANGTLTIAVPNPASLDAHYYGLYWAAYDVPRHVNHFLPSTLKHLVEKFGFKLEKQYPMYLDAFYIALLSEQYKNKQNSLLTFIKAFWVGLKSNRAASKSGNYSSLVYVFRKT